MTGGISALVAGLRRNNRFTVAALLFAALVLRLVWLHYNPVLHRDAVLYCRLMEQLHSGGWNSLPGFWDGLDYNEPFWIPPLPLYLLSLPMFFGFTANVSGIIMNMLAGLSVVAAVYFIALELFRRRAYAVFAASLVVVHPALVKMSCCTLRDGVYSAAVAWTLYFLLRFYSGKRAVVSMAAAALLLLSAVMIRFEGYEILFLTAVWFFYDWLFLRRGGGIALIVAVAAAMSVAAGAAMLLPSVRECVFGQQLPRLLMYFRDCQEGGDWSDILFYKIAAGIFSPLFFFGLAGLVVLMISEWKKRPVRYLALALLFMIVWRFLYRINSSRYAGNLIVPFIMLAVYAVDYAGSRLRVRGKNTAARIVSAGMAVALIAAGAAKNLHYNPYAGNVLRICALLSRNPDGKAVLTNKEYERFSYLLNRPVVRYDPYNPRELSRALSSGNDIIFYYRVSNGMPERLARLPYGGCYRKCFESYVDRRCREMVILYSRAD